MAERVISPTGRGFLLLDSHPTGCERSVADMRAQVPANPAGRPGQRPVALVIGSSSGYGLAATVAGLVRHGINGVGIAFEKAPGSPYRDRRLVPHDRHRRPRRRAGQRRDLHQR